MGNESTVPATREMDLFISFASNNTTHIDYKNQLESRHNKQELYSAILPQCLGYYEVSDNPFTRHHKLTIFFVYILPKIAKYGPEDEQEWKCRCAGFIKVILKGNNRKTTEEFYDIMKALRKQYGDEWVREMLYSRIISRKIERQSARNPWTYSSELTLA
jgi:hypothetical protein